MTRSTWRKTAAVAIAMAAAAVIVPRDASPQTPAGPAWVDRTRRGEARFYQHCSLCHMGRIVKDDVYDPMGPRLSGVFKNVTPEREKVVRTQIQQGSPRMP